MPTATAPRWVRVQEILADIYAQVLGLQRVGVDDSFFDLGGDSLSAMRLIGAVNTSLDADLSVRTVFEAPTVAQLAPRVGGDARRLEPLVGRRGPEVPLSFAEQVVVLRSVAGARRRSTTWRWRCDCAADSTPRALRAALKRRGRVATNPAHPVRRPRWHRAAGCAARRAGRHRRET